MQQQQEPPLLPSTSCLQQAIAALQPFDGTNHPAYTTTPRADPIPQQLRTTTTTSTAGTTLRRSVSAGAFESSFGGLDLSEFEKTTTLTTTNAATNLANPLNHVSNACVPLSAAAAMLQENQRRKQMRQEQEQEDVRFQELARKRALAVKKLSSHAASSDDNTMARSPWKVEPSKDMDPVHTVVNALVVTMHQNDHHNDEKKRMRVKPPKQSVRTSGQRFNKNNNNNYHQRDTLSTHKSNVATGRKKAAAIPIKKHVKRKSQY